VRQMDLEEVVEMLVKLQAEHALDTKLLRQLLLEHPERAQLVNTVHELEQNGVSAARVSHTPEAELAYAARAKYWKGVLSAG
jgi:hypothetical protein